MTTESEAVKTVADLMAIAARTAPKAVGIDSIGIEVVTGKEIAKLAKEMIKIGDAMGVDFFRINGEQVKNSDACAVTGSSAVGMQGATARSIPETSDQRCRRCFYGVLCTG